MTSYNRSVFSPTLLGLSLFLTLVFSFPHSLHATELPHSLSLTTDDTVKVIPPKQYTEWFTVRNTTTYHPSLLPEGEVPVTNCSQLTWFCEGFVPRSYLRHFITQGTLTLNRERSTQELSILLEEIDRDPINAKLGMDESKKLIVTSEAVPGLRIDQTQSIATILDTLDTNQEEVVRIPLATEVLPAKVSRDTITALGLTDQIATATTNFRGSPKNRIFNIHRAIEQFDGVVLAPDEEFSFVDYLGEVDGEHGYLPELVIKNNKTEPEFGGGICQVSTTVFRTALNAGLEITERRNHAYPVQYYKPYGMDATIYIPRPDLKFKNNTPGSILMLPTITGTELTFTFYGTQDGRSITIDGPHILEAHSDGSMRTIFTQTVKDKNGNTFIDQTFPSNYKSPSLFPHPGQEPVYTVKPKDWSEKQWKEYKSIHS